MATETLFPVKKLIRMTEELEKQISHFRFSQRIPSENEAIRQLIQLGLETARARQKETAK